MLDVVARRGKCTLRNAGYAVAHILEKEAVEIPNNAHHGDIDIRENIRRCADNSERTQDHDEYGQHYERVGTPKREPNNPRDLQVWIGIQGRSALRSWAKRGRVSS